MNLPAPLAIGFLSPGLFVAGALLMAAPIIIHLLNRRRFKVVQWAAMDYLLKALKKNRRRLKFESLLLLITRCAVLIFLGAALARPFGCQDSNIAAAIGRRSGLTVLVIDNGYAMGYEANRPLARTNLDQAKILAKQIINRLSSGGEAVVILPTAGLHPSTPPSPTYDLEAAKAMVDRIDLSYGATDMLAALNRAHQVALAATSLPARSLYILDDSTHHVWSAGGAPMQQLGKDLAADFAAGIAHFDLGRPNEFNPAVLDLTFGQRLATLVGDFAPSFSARLKAYGTGPDPELVWKIDDAKVETGAGAESSGPIHLDLSDHLATLGRASFSTGGPHVVAATLATDDKLTCDDTRWRVVNVASDLKMLIVEGERQSAGDDSTPAGGAGVYLKAALDPDPDPSDTLAKKNRLVNIDTISDLELGSHPLGDYRCIALCGVGQLTDAIAARLERFVSDGGALWIFMGPRAAADNYNATLLKHHLLPGAMVHLVVVPTGANSNSDGVMFDFDPARQVHPLLAPFYQSQGSGLESARVYSYWQVDIPPNSPVEHVLDYQLLPGATHRDPAFTVHSVGRGRVVFCSTTADANDEWTAFPAKKAFPEVMLCLFLGTVRTDEDWMNLTVDQSVLPPPGIKVTAAPRLHDAAGGEYAITAAQADDGNLAYRSVPLIKPGVYTLTTGDATYPIAVNVPSEESDTRHVDDNIIRQALGAVAIDFQQDSLPPQAAVAQQGRDFGWPIMLAVLVLAAAESFMAMRFGRYKRK